MKTKEESYTCSERKHVNVGETKDAEDRPYQKE